MIAYCGCPPAASSCDPFPYIVPAMRGKRSQESARWGTPSLRRSLVSQAPDMQDSTLARSVVGGTFLRQPRALATLFFTEMWERFTYYGMRSVLILFLVGEVSRGGLGFDDQTASSIYGLYICGTYMFAPVGGWIADRLIGPGRAVIGGSLFIIAGNTLLITGQKVLFFLGLVVIVLGVGLMKPNISAMVARLYPEGGSRRDAGFSIFYMGISVGAVLGSLLVPLCAARYGWNVGFALPVCGMVFGLGYFLATRGRLPQTDEITPQRAAAWLPVILLLLVIATIALGAATGHIQ